MTWQTFILTMGKLLSWNQSVVNAIPDTEMFILLQAYQHLGEVNIPKFTVIVAQKNHHTRFFLPGASENVPPGQFLKLVSKLFTNIPLIPVVC